jgi:hypothetical protein
MLFNSNNSGSTKSNALAKLQQIPPITTAVLKKQRISYITVHKALSNENPFRNANCYFAKLLSKFKKLLSFISCIHFLKCFKEYCELLHLPAMGNALVMITFEVI